MRHYCYRITNTCNGKIYIGIHSCNGEFLDSGYYGSGTAQLSAIEKYGIKNFTREVIFEGDTRQSVADKEMELVTLEFINQKNNYNLKTGGEHSTFRNSEETKVKQSHSAKRRPPISEETRAKIRYNSSNQSKETRIKKSARVKGEGNPFYGRSHSEKTKESIRQAKLGGRASAETKVKLSLCQSGEGNGFFGKTHSDESKAKISLAQTGVKLVERTCPHCNLTGRGGNMTRYHFNKCKEYKRSYNG